MSKIRLLMVDDHRMFLQGLRMLIEMDAAFRLALADERKPQEETQEPERLQKPPT